MMKIHVVDAFAHQPFTGNPAGVLLLDEFPDDVRLQSVAAEMSHPMTAFAHPLPEGSTADWALRWFTPRVEVAMCGHGTLATAHVLHGQRLVDGPVRFATRSGVLVARPGKDGSTTLDLPTAPLHPVDPPETVVAALGTKPLQGFHIGERLNDLLLELADENAVRTLAPDIRSLIDAVPHGVIVTARAEHDSLGYDYVSRCFLPGIAEDPVTGSAHTALAPFWSQRLGRARLTGLQASRRTGLVHTELKGERTLLTGKAVTVLEGELLV